MACGVLNAIYEYVHRVAPHPFFDRSRLWVSMRLQWRRKILGICDSLIMSMSSLLMLVERRRASRRVPTDKGQRSVVDSEGRGEERCRSGSDERERRAVWRRCMRGTRSRRLSRSGVVWRGKSRVACRRGAQKLQRQPCNTVYVVCMLVHRETLNRFRTYYQRRWCARCSATVVSRCTRSWVNTINGQRTSPTLIAAPRISRPSRSNFTERTVMKLC